MNEILKKCTLCPRKCKVNRYESVGFCKAKERAKVAHISLHQYEEPCISNKNGSGTIFFSGCNLACKFCQNYEISTNEYGKELTDEELANLIFKLQEMGADNVNLVSPTIYAINIINALKIAKQKGLNIPIIYNTNGYENVETLKLLEGYIDVFLPDFKYSNQLLAKEFSNAENYLENVLACIKECKRQQPKNVYDENGKILKGVIIRHLILPNYILNTKNVLKYIKEDIKAEDSVSIMTQYFPTYKAKNIPKLNRKINKKEYKKVLEYIETYDIDGFIQPLLNENEEKYVPIFNVDSLK